MVGSQAGDCDAVASLLAGEMSPDDGGGARQENSPAAGGLRKRVASVGGAAMQCRTEVELGDGGRSERRDERSRMLHQSGSGRRRR